MEVMINISKIIILPVGSVRVRNSVFSLYEKCRSKGVGKRAVRRIFGPERRSNERMEKAK
jgi:predicted acetyltransferase